ncbi:MAG TPA: ATP-binding protein [Bdellovibrionales bacterium]|nr:ATP-binding protein [Bdellovibrionales bacterium]
MKTESELNFVVSTERIREIVDDIRSEFEHSLSYRKNRVHILMTSSTTLPLGLKCDEYVIRESLTTLLRNAVDALGGGPGVVRIGLRASAAYLSISVEDNGRGISFENERLSLRELRKDLEAMGARLDLQSRLGVGSRNSILLRRLDSTPSQFRTLSRQDDFRYRNPSSQLG